MCRLTENYSGSDLTALARDAALGPIRGRRLVELGYQFMFRARMYRSLIPVSNSVKDQRTAHIEIIKE